jgi:NTE family protein
VPRGLADSDLVKRGLILAGGGLAGIAWETGVLTGIADESPDTAAAVLAADVLLGTSAGSAVAAQLGGGASLTELYARQVAAESHEIDSGVDIDGIAEIFLSALTEPGDAAAKLRRVGAIAVATDTVPEALRREVIAHRLPVQDWPERDLRITAIPVDTGELVVFTAESGVPLVDAVAASCAVPGVWPPVTIGSRRYMDGGVRSAVNTSAAEDCDAVVVLVPAGEHAPSPFSSGAAAEIAAFPGRTLAVFADDDAVAAFGRNPLDPRCRQPSAVAGRAQGRRVAEAVSRFLS